MPIKYRSEVREINHIEYDGFICDCCKKEYPAEDWVNQQEMLDWTNGCGYGSLFGD